MAQGPVIFAGEARGYHPAGGRSLQRAVGCACTSAGHGNEAGSEARDHSGNQARHGAGDETRRTGGDASEASRQAVGEAYDHEGPRIPRLFFLRLNHTVPRA